MLWINFLHCYQPANSDAYKIKEAAELSYQRVVRALKENPRFKITMNISGCLVLRLVDLGYHNLIRDINNLVAKGQLELVSSAAYHALLPLVKAEEVKNQIKENKEIMSKYFPKLKLRGFFLPEMAYSPEVAKIIKEEGYSWIILDEISSSRWDIDFLRPYIDRASGLKIIFRSRLYSNSYPPDKIQEILSTNKSDNLTIISATDGELYGLKHQDPSGELEKVVRNKKVKTKLISEYIKSFKNLEKITLRKSNWESSEEELKNGQFYYLWYNKNNIIQLELWKMADFCFTKLKKYKQNNNFFWARWHFVRGLASCTFWWASAKDFKHNFGPLAWSPDEIERGLDEFIRSIRSLEGSTSYSEKKRAEDLYLSIKKNVWDHHWSKKYKKI